VRSIAGHSPRGARYFSECCTHVKGHGGAKAALRRAVQHLPGNRFVLRTNVKSYYASVDHFLLLEQLADYVEARAVLKLFWQYMRRSLERGGVFWDVQKGISLGCPTPTSECSRR
jgi:RNA-directed DNA polymerase